MAYNNKITVTSLTSPLATGVLKSTTGTGELTIAINSDLPVMTSTVGGAVPTPPNNTTTFLRGDGTFAAPSGASGDVVGPASAVNDSIATYNGTTGKIIKDSGKAIPAGSVVGTSDTQTLTDKRITLRVTSTANSATPTPDISTTDLFIITAQSSATAAFANPVGTPLQGDRLLIRIKDNGTSRAITWGTNYRAMGVALPSATTISKTMYLGYIYNSTDTKWDLIAYTQEI